MRNVIWIRKYKSLHVVGFPAVPVLVCFTLELAPPARLPAKSKSSHEYASSPAEFAGVRFC